MQHDERTLRRRNLRLAWFLLFLGFGLSVGLFFAGRFFGGR
jgi:hypothetical protein